MKKMLSELDEMENDLELERRARDIGREQLYKEEVELAGEQDILDSIAHQSFLKNGVADLEKDRN